MFLRTRDLWLLPTLLFCALTLCCNAQTEEQALENLRSLTRDGQLPPENVVTDLERRFSGKRAGALARLIHARIRFDAGDYAGAAALLDTDVFRNKTKVADEALWLRARALEKTGNNAEALKAADLLVRDFPQSIRARDGKLIWARAAIASGRAIDVPPFLVDLSESNDADALLLTAKAYEPQNSIPDAIRYYRRTYFFAAGSQAAQEAEAKLTALQQPLTPQSSGEQVARAEQLIKAKNYAEAARALDVVGSTFPNALTPEIQLRRVTAYASAGRMADATAAFNAMPGNAKEREEGYRQLVLGYAKAKQWPQAKTTADDMRAKVTNVARDAKDSVDASYFFNSAATSYPNAIEVAPAQFEAAWQQHDAKNYALSSQMFIEHLARYADKDTSNRGKAGYWAARDSERAGKTAEACALYDGTIYRYGANWYGYLSAQRLAAMRSAGKCQSTAAPNPTVAKAVANLRTVTVAAETAGQREREVVAKADELSIIGLYDWAIDELNDAKRTAGNSPSVNLALARFYRIRKWRNDNTNAFVALAKSYPDYAQMFPEEMAREEWSIFYPLSSWNEIKYWAGQRNLDPYQVAGLIRQESVFDPKAASPAKAYGLMQLIVPTAQLTARKYGSSLSGNLSVDTLLQPQPSIELGTAYLRDMLDKFGRIEYVAVAYNAGPGRVPQWRSTLPAEIDEFVEAIPFKETKQYVQGIIRNSAQYRRLYDENGNFRSNVGSKPLRGQIDGEPREQFTAENPDVNVDDSAGE
jgi:soluble lytic murein transglycosylase